VFAAEFEDLIDPLLGFDGPLAQRLQAVQEAAPLRVPSHVVLRELLSLTLVHSKSLVPASLLDDRDALRKLIQRAVLTDLETHRVADEALSARGADPFVASANADWYESPLEDSFAWLTSQDVAHRSLADDVLDALRLLRVADALRQRGTSLRTTGGYEILIDAATGEVVFSLRTADDAKLYLLRGHNARSAGEANLRAVTVDVRRPGADRLPPRRLPRARSSDRGRRERFAGNRRDPGGRPANAHGRDASARPSCPRD
jgi:hypothetical protein